MINKVRLFFLLLCMPLVHAIKSMPTLKIDAMFGDVAHLCNDLFKDTHTLKNAVKDDVVIDALAQGIKNSNLTSSGGERTVPVYFIKNNDNTYAWCYASGNKMQDVQEAFLEITWISDRKTYLALLTVVPLLAIEMRYKTERDRYEHYVKFLCKQQLEAAEQGELLQFYDDAVNYDDIYAMSTISDRLMYAHKRMLLFYFADLVGVAVSAMEEEHLQYGENLQYNDLDYIATIFAGYDKPLDSATVDAVWCNIQVMDCDIVAFIASSFLSPVQKVALSQTIHDTVDFISALQCYNDFVVDLSDPVISQALTTMAFRLAGLETNVPTVDNFIMQQVQENMVPTLMAWIMSFVHDTNESRSGRLDQLISLYEGYDSESDVYKAMHYLKNNH